MAWESLSQHEETLQVILMSVCEGKKERRRKKKEAYWELNDKIL
jgi:hypothetical protein